MEAALLDARVGTLDAIVATALADLAGWLDTVGDVRDPEAVTTDLRGVAPAVVLGYGEMAGVAAADWYAEVRPTGARPFTPAPVVPDGLTEHVDRLVSWAAGPLFTAGDTGAMFERLAGGVQRFVAEHDRETVMVAAQRDPVAIGWQRRASASACAFCAYMAVVSPDEAGEDARHFHAHCHCQSVPLFSREDDLAQPERDRYEADAERAREVLMRRRREVGYDRLPRSRRPKELALTTRNILAVMREQGYR